MKHPLVILETAILLTALAAPAGGREPVARGDASARNRHWLLVSVPGNVTLKATSRSEGSPDFSVLTSAAGNVCVEWEFRIVRRAENATRKPGAGIWQTGEDGVVQVQMDESGEVSYSRSSSGPVKPQKPRKHSGLDPAKWQKVRLERRRRELLVMVGGKTIVTDTLATDKTGDVYTSAFARQCDAQFRNVRVYVESAVRADNGKIAEALGSADKCISAGDLAGARKACKVLAATLGRAPEAKEFFHPIRDRLNVLKTLMSREGLRLDRAAGLKLCSFDPDQWSLKGRWLVGKCPKPKPKDPKVTITTKDIDGRPMKVWGTLNIPVVLAAYEVTGLIDRDTSLPESSVGFHWNYSGYDEAHPWVEIQPKQAVMYTGCWESGLYVKKLIAQAELPRSTAPLPFCIRVDRSKAALFIGDGAKPLLKSDSLPVPGRNVTLHYQHFPKGKRPRFGRLRIGRIPETAKVDSPVKLPKAE